MARREALRLIVVEEHSYQDRLTRCQPSRAAESGGCTAATNRTVSSTYTNGFVTGVTGYASSTRNTPTTWSNNRLTGSTYDAAGALTNWNGAVYKYDEAGMMWNMVSGSEDWLNIYTADDERIWSYKPAANLSRWTLRGLDNKVLREYQNAGGTWSVQKDYVYRGGEPLAAETPTGVNHLHTDHLGTVRAITNSAGTRIAYHHYFPFGEEATSAVQNTERMKFTGHERDLANASSAADDLDYMHARFYNPLTGRFLSTDPAEHRSASNLSQHWNRFVYTRGNPLALVDPDGKEPATATVTVGGIVVVATIAVTYHFLKMATDDDYRKAAQSADAAVLDALGKTRDAISSLVITSNTTAPGEGQPPPTAVPGARPRTTPPPPLVNADRGDKKQPPQGDPLLETGKQTRRHRIWDLVGRLLDPTPK